MEDGLGHHQPEQQLSLTHFPLEFPGCLLPLYLVLYVGRVSDPRMYKETRTYFPRMHPQLPSHLVQ